MKSQRMVILDTDIGEDIDDIWALCMMLKSPELKPLLITTATEDTRYRAKIVCKFLEIAGRTEVPVGIGAAKPGDRRNKTHASWVEDYYLENYSGILQQDGITALITTIRAAAEPVTLLCIGPLTNIGIALERAPDIASRCHFVGMFGSISTGLFGVPGCIPENNIIRDLRASQAVFTADWLSMTITPLDSCGIVKLENDHYRSVCACREPAISAVIENYRLWTHSFNKFEQCSSALYDTVAIHLAYSQEYLKLETMNIIVDNDGYTKQDSGGRQIQVATGWYDLNGYLAALVRRMTGPIQPA